MTETGRGRRDIVLNEVLPHPPETVWAALTKAELIGRWLMPPTGFKPIEGQRFTFQTTPAGAWDGVIHCEVLEVRANERLAFSWKGGDDGNAGYGSRLDTVVSFTLTRVDGGTRLRLVHAGFDPTKNDTAVENLGEGWRMCIGRLDGLVAGRA